MDHHHHQDSTTSGFSTLAIAVLCTMATAFLLLTYYYFVTKTRFNWQQVNPLRRFSMPRARPEPDPFSSPYSTPPRRANGLHESVIRDMPILQYTKIEGEMRMLHECVVCLNEFQELDTLRVLPRCNHGFHLDCIDIWLQTNANCPLCRLSISGQRKADRILAPTSSPQDPTSSNQDFLIIELGEEGSQQSVSRKSNCASITGDESINVIRRSFSMDSAIDRHVYLTIQEIVNNGSTSGRTRRHFFSFGSRNAVLPIEF